LEYHDDRVPFPSYVRLLSRNLLIISSISISNSFDILIFPDALVTLFVEPIWVSRFLVTLNIYLMLDFWITYKVEYGKDVAYADVKTDEDLFDHLKEWQKDYKRHLHAAYEKYFHTILVKKVDVQIYEASKEQKITELDMVTELPDRLLRSLRRKLKPDFVPLEDELEVDAEVNSNMTLKMEAGMDIDFERELRDDVAREWTILTLAHVLGLRYYFPIFCALVAIMTRLFSR